MRILIIICILILSLSFENMEIQKEGFYSASFAELSTNLTKISTLKANFTQTKKIKALKRPLISAGELIFDRQAGVFWKLTKPFESTIVIDNEKLTSLDDNGKKITIKASEKPMLYGFTKIFLSIFSGNTEELKKHFQIYYKTTPDGWQIGLIPTASELEKVLSKILLSGSENEVKNISLWETNGDLTEIVFSDIAKLEKLSAEDLKKFELK